jgi:SAM-dependent methyltransferase
VKYTTDEYGKELLFDKKTNYQVMMEWEKPYMEALIDNLKPTGDVLEIGFGLGYSANKIQSYDIKSYTVIENDPKVLEVAREWAKKQKHPVTIIPGDWQEVIFNLGKFDTIFFDDAPSEKYPDPGNVRFYYFYYLALQNHVNIGCRMSWYCDLAMYWICHPDTDFVLKRFNIDIPDNAEYITDFAKENKVLCMPVITFKHGCTDNIAPIFLDKNLSFGFFKN